MEDVAIDSLSLDYLAGFFDGEGCITAFFPNNSHGRFRCLITVTNTNIRILREYKRRWGGKIYPHSNTRKQCYVLHMNLTSTLNCLYDLVDLLFDKKKQAELAIELLCYSTSNYRNCDLEIVDSYVKCIQLLKE